MVFTICCRGGRWVVRACMKGQWFLPSSTEEMQYTVLYHHSVRLLNVNHHHQNNGSATSAAELSKETVDGMLRSREETVLINQGAVQSYEVNQLGANSPCEDQHSEGKCLATGGYLFGVFDGHAGGSCSRAACRRLYDYVCTSLLPMAHIRGPHLHVANVGDSCAVLAVCNENGSWTARRLNQEHCIDNPLEVKRIRSEHPTKESSTVLKDLQKVVLQPVYGYTSLPVGFQTPPYLRATPEVFYHRLTPNDKFLILASDGLWEMLTPERVVRLISDHMLGRQTLSPYNCNGNMAVHQILAELRLRKQGASKRPMDMNSATHVIRHALGGDNLQTQYYHLNAMLTLPPELARNYRDDITVAIIYFDCNYLLSLD